jgi:hypothetical protein
MAENVKLLCHYCLRLCFGNTILNNTIIDVVLGH